MSKDDALKDIYYAIGLFVFIVIEVLIVQLALFSGGGAEKEENLFVVLISLGAGIFGSIAIFLLKLAQFFSKKFNGERKYGWMGSIVHDPEISDLPIEKKGLRWLKNPFITALVFLIPTSILGTIQVYQNQFWTAIPARVAQQITETAEGILSTFPADQEIYIPLALCGLMIFIFRWMKKYRKIDESTEKLLQYLIIPIAFVAFWFPVHYFNHGTSDIALRYVFLFGTISGLLLAIFKSMIPVLIFKVTNNLYAWLNGFIGSDERVLLITFFFNLFLVIILALIFSMRAKGAET